MNRNTSICFTTSSILVFAFASGCNDYAEVPEFKFGYETAQDAAVTSAEELVAAETDAAKGGEVASAKDEDKGKEKVTVLGDPKAEDDAERVAKLEDAGAEIKRNSNGLAIEVHIRKAEVTDAMAEEISALENLVKLTINNSSMSNESWEKLSNLKELQHLDLRGCKVSSKKLASAVAGMPKLRALRLNGKSGATTVDDLAMKALANCPDLKALALDHLWIGEDGLKALGECKSLAELYMAGTLVDDAGMEVIAKFPRLRKLRVAQTSVSGDGLQAIKNLKLEDLDLSECSQLFDDAMSQLGSIKTLKRLNLFKVVVSDVGVAELAGLTNLEWLNLDQTQLTDEGLPALKQMSALSFLHLGSTGVSDAGMEELIPLQSLKDLKVTRTAVTEKGVETVEKGIKAVKVQLKYVEGQ